MSRWIMLFGRVDQVGRGTGAGSPVVRRMRVLGWESFSWDDRAARLALGVSCSSLLPVKRSRRRETVAHSIIRSRLFS